jgi:hypothetical protein
MGRQRDSTRAINATHVTLPFERPPPMTDPSIRWGLAAVATLLAEITLITLSIMCVAVYSYAIHTGETAEFYSAFAKVSGPWVSLIAGGPVFFLIARWIRRRAPAAAVGTAMALSGFYVAIEVAILLLWPGDSSATLAALPFVIGGFVLKVTGAWLGAGGTSARAPAKTA